MPNRLTRTMQALIDAHDYPFVLIGEDYRVAAANQAYQVAYGVAAEEVIGRPCYEVSHHRDSPCWQHGEQCPHREAFQHDRACEVLHTHYLPGGRSEHVRIRGYVVPQPDGRRLLGEAITRVALAEEIDCEEMRLIGRSPAFLRALDELTRAAHGHAHVLLTGECGVGKELAARYLHQHSQRADGPYVTADAGAFTEAQFDADLLGSEHAGSGCLGRRPGLLAQADGGTLFIDEVDRMSLPMQARLLATLERGAFRRAGAREACRFDVRLIAATSREPRALVGEGCFREDLYYRLAGIRIDLPPLRARRSDIPALAEALLAHISKASGRRCYLTGEAMERLTHHDFPGNMRELRAVLQRATSLCAVARGGAIRAQDILFDSETPVTTAAPPATDGRGPVRTPTMRDVESHYLADLLIRFNGHRRAVADAMGISERTLYRKLKRYGLG